MAVLSAVAAKVWLFHLKSCESARRSLSLNVVREICFDIEGFFAAIFASRMELYDFNSHETTRHKFPTGADAQSGYIQVDRTTVLVVGNPVQTLNLLTLQVTFLVPLLTPSGSDGQHCVCLWGT